MSRTSFPWFAVGDAPAPPFVPELYSHLRKSLKKTNSSASQAIACTVKTPDMHDSAPGRLSHQMHALVEKMDGKDASLGEILGSFSRRSHAVLMVFLSFPLCLPVGIPVLTTALGLTLVFVGLFLALGREPWLPQRLRAKTISHERLTNIVDRLLRITKRIERWLHPRLLILATNGPVIRLHGVFAMVMALMAAIPISLPLNNMVAAVPVFLLGLSLLERDGILVIVSYVAAIPCVLYYAALAFLGLEGFEHLTGL